VGTEAVTGGSIRFDLLWVPLTKNARISG
jgi:hypothetical protein